LLIELLQIFQEVGRGGLVELGHARRGLEARVLREHLGPHPHPVLRGLTQERDELGAPLDPRRALGHHARALRQAHADEPRQRERDAEDRRHAEDPLATQRHQ
jgi:hypothetical protein